MSINGLALGTNNISAQLATKLDVAGGKVLQIVRATDTTNRSTTSTSFVDANLSVTITPQKSTSAVLLIANVNASKGGADSINLRISDSSNNAISGAELATLFSNAGMVAQQTVIAYATPGTTSATTFKLRFHSGGGTSATIQNASNTGQLYAIEVSA